MKRENNLNVNTALAKIKSFLKHFKAVKMRSGKNFYHINANSFLLRFIIKITNYSRRKYFWYPQKCEIIFCALSNSPFELPIYLSLFQLFDSKLSLFISLLLFLVLQIGLSLLFCIASYKTITLLYFATAIVVDL